MGVRLGIVVSEFNKEITDVMLDRAKKHARELRCKVTHICKVPGAFDMPLILQCLLEKQDVDAVATIGAIVKGETQHDQVIGHQLASRISELSLRFKKPVTLGISGPGMSWDQGVARAEEYAERSVKAAVTLAQRLSKLTDGKPSSYPFVVE